MARYDEFDDEHEPILAPFLKNLKAKFGVRYIALGLGLCLVVGVAFMLMGDNNPSSDGSNIPVVKADTTPYKILPEEIGGMAVPNQHSTIFETLAGQDKKRVENLLADEEQPMTKAEIMPEEKVTETVDEKTEENIVEKPVTEKVTMVDPKADTTKPEPMPAPPEAGEVANTEPSAAPSKILMDEVKKSEEPKSIEAKIITDIKAESKPKEELKTETSKTETLAGSKSVQFAAVKSDPEARALWKKLQSQNPELSAYTLRVQKADLNEKGVFYRVQVAGLSADSASSLCAKVKSRGGSCMVVK